MNPLDLILWALAILVGVVSAFGVAVVIWLAVELIADGVRVGLRKRAARADR